MEPRRSTLWPSYPLAAMKRTHRPSWMTTCPGSSRPLAASHLAWAAIAPVPAPRTTTTITVSHTTPPSRLGVSCPLWLLAHSSEARAS